MARVRVRVRIMVRDRVRVRVKVKVKVRVRVRVRVRAEGVPSGSRKSRQLEPLMVEGRPPAVTKTSASTRLCMELRLAAPSAVSAE